LAERAGPGSFMLAPGGPGCKSAGPCHLYIRYNIWSPTEIFFATHANTNEKGL